MSTRGLLTRTQRLLALLLAALVFGAMVVAFNVSFAAIIYQGEFARFVDRGIALTLLGAAPMAVVGAFACSYRGTVCQPQDAPAIILALAGASIAAGMADPASERGFATMAALVIATSAACGLTAWLLGRLRLGFVARFIPFPVLGGFLAATGLLLVLGALGIAVGESMEIRNLEVLFAPSNPVRWLPWTALGVATILLLRRFDNPLALPLTIFAAGLGFYLVLWLLGLGIDDARTRGLLLGPFGEGGFLPALDGWQPLAADWRAIAAQTPSILAAIGVSTATALLSASALEVLTGTPVDPDRDLRGIGLCNLASAAGGGPIGYHVISETMLARGMGLAGPASGLVAGAACVAALVFGASAISMIPVGVLVLLVMVIGLAMLLDPLVDQRRSLPAADYAVVLIIPAVTAAFGFIWGVAVGLLAAALFFLMAFARIDVVRLETTAARMRSRLERPEPEQARLAQLGEQARIYVLAGYIFFGTAHRLVSRIQSVVTRAAHPRFVLIDFHRVRGIDTSAARALARLADACQAERVTLYLTGLAAADARLISGQVTGPWPRIVPRLEEALEQIEAALLSDAAPAETSPTLLDRFRRDHPAANVESYFEAVSVPAGAEVITQGASPDFLLVLRSGLLRTEVTIDGADPVIVARCLPGALVGEIGLYAGIPRTARVVAEEPSEFLRIDASALDRMARDDPSLLADFHRMIAATIARRLGRTTALLADSELQAG